jgi:hypothetical protein
LTTLRLLLCSLLALGALGCSSRTPTAPRPILLGASAAPASAKASADAVTVQAIKPKIALGPTAAPASPVATPSPSASPTPAPSTGPAGLLGPESAARTSPSDKSVLRLSGTAYAPDGLSARTSNVKAGRVIGSPLRIEDARTGRVLKQGVTYYDGSFQIDVPLGEGPQALVLSIDLVDAADPKKTLTLSAPLSADRALGMVERLQVSPGTTGLVLLYRKLAAAKGSASGLEMAKLVLATTPDALEAFAGLMGRDKAVQGAADVPGLDAALKAYVARSSS